MIKHLLKDIYINEDNVEISFKLGFLEDFGFNMDNVDDGLVLVVTIIATGMIAFSDGFKSIMQDTLENQWNSMTANSEK